MAGFKKPIGPHVLAPIEILEVPKGYEFESIEVIELEGRQSIIIHLDDVPPPVPDVVFYASLDEEDGCNSVHLTVVDEPYFEQA